MRLAKPRSRWSHHRGGRQNDLALRLFGVRTNNYCEISGWCRRS
ncbi:hypothetical protein I553_10535 [Mycobacterium xenopi 4042]|uniref:Uncharacterized protein n=1 Tax=Mycobacterium xenopi 4042 TaxID=1299334 RepID=X8DIA7_MYCXE|nr:hypothetical protein I553_10535 [Mycobacterium xenopi 4042]